MTTEAVNRPLGVGQREEVAAHRCRRCNREHACADPRPDDRGRHAKDGSGFGSPSPFSRPATRRCRTIDGRTATQNNWSAATERSEVIKLDQEELEQEQTGGRPRGSHRHSHARDDMRSWLSGATLVGARHRPGDFWPMLPALPSEAPCGRVGYRRSLSGGSSSATRRRLPSHRGASTPKQHSPDRRARSQVLGLAASNMGRHRDDVTSASGPGRCLI